MRCTIDLAWPYDRALAEMHAARDAVIAGGDEHVFVGSHSDEVVTLGRNASEAQLVGRAALADRGVLVRRIERGGGATAHGPGQLVVYPVIHLERHGLDVVTLTSALLGAAVDLAAERGIAARAQLDPAGVYVDGAKLASIGFRVERGVVTHGLAINAVNDLTLFDLIAPCGICDQQMTSLQREGARASLPDLAERLVFHVARRCVLALTVMRLTGDEAVG